MSMEADYVVVGAGSAGCAVAARLAARPGVRVVLLEAGGRALNPWLHVPIGFARTMYHPTLSWNLKTAPEAELGGRQIDWPRGRVMGGSSAINGLIYIRGQAEDYDHWRQLGCIGWSFADVLPHFRAAEDNERGADALHGKGGPLGVSDLRDRNPISAAFIEAAKQLGFPENPDFNGPDQEGAGWYQVTVRNGLRCSAAKAYLTPKPANLDILTEAPARRLVIENGRCTGVVYAQGGAEKTVAARAEVILCGGAIPSPQLLMLSGVGDGAHLSAMGIETRHHLPAVGRNLQDHFQARMIFRANQKVTFNDVAHSLWGQLRTGLEFAFKRSGPLTFAAGTSGLFARVMPQSATPDVQFHFVPFSVASPGKLHDFPGFTMSMCQLRPESRGTITLASPDPTAQALIHANYLAEKFDRDCITAGLRLTRQLAATPALSRWIESEFAPGVDADSDEALLEFARNTGHTIYHPSGTCRMGEDASSVVDSRLRLRGVAGLRVADASIMPTVVSGNTNAACIMIGEKCAAMIAEDSAQRMAA